MRMLAAVGGILLAGLMAGEPGIARACEVPALAGVWENPHARNPQDVTRLEIAHVCQTQLTGNRAVVPGSTWTVRVFSKCAPRDCKWGREPAHMDGEGRLVVTFPTFSAQRTVRIAPAGHAVYVDVAIDYHDARREDRVENLVFLAAD